MFFTGEDSRAGDFSLGPSLAREGPGLREAIQGYSNTELPLDRRGSVHHVPVAVAQEGQRIILT